MFQFTALAACAYEFSTGRFGNPGINARLSTSPGLSQTSTPFDASRRQDIPHAPFVAWPHESNAPAKNPAEADSCLLGYVDRTRLRNRSTDPVHVRPE